MAKKYYTVKFQEFLDLFEPKFQEYITHVMTQWFIRLEFLNFSIDTFGKPQALRSGLTFTHFCLVTGNLLPNFLTTVNHSFFNIMSSVIPLDKNGGIGEKNAQVEILI